MFKLASIKHQSSIVFLAVALLSVLCLVQSVKAQDELEDEADLGIEPIDEEDFALEQPPRLSCRYNCTRPYSPLCGSDRKTYGNMCHLNTKNRLDNTNIRRVSNGTCQLCNRVTHPVVTCNCDCPTNRARCFLSSFPNRPVTCRNINRPVCGTNGVTYRNACQLALRTACLGYPVRVCHSGRCRPRMDEDEELGIVEIDEKTEAETLETSPQIQF